MSSSANGTFERREVEDYERRRYRGFDQRFVDGREKRILRKIFRRLREEAGPDGQPRERLLVLDAPCGYGRFSELLLGESMRLVSGDLSFHMVERAMEKRWGGRRMSGVVSDLKRGLPFKPACFDYVFSMRFFHHLRESEDRLNVLREFARVAREGVVLSYYRTSGLHAFQRNLRRFLKKTQRRITMIPGDVFENEAGASGMTVEKTFPLLRRLHAQHIVLLKKGFDAGSADLPAGIRSSPGR